MGIVPTYSAHHDRLPDVLSVRMFDFCFAVINLVAISNSPGMRRDASVRRSIRRPRIGDADEHRRPPRLVSNERGQAARIRDDGSLGR